MQPLSGLLVIDFSRYTPGPFASRELLRLGARVVRVEPPDGDPLRALSPAWEAALNAGKESVVADLKTAQGFELAQALVERADVVLDGFRPGVLERLGVRFPARTVVCAISGFGAEGWHSRRAGHDLNYVGWAGLLADTAPALPPTQIADLCAGSLAAVGEILAALLARERTGRGARADVSMTHGSQRLVAHRLGTPGERLLTGGLACYRIYATADGRFVTVGALEPKFFRRLCEILGLEHLVRLQYEPEVQEQLARELSAAFAARPLAHWIERFDAEDACVGPVATVEEAAADLAPPPLEPAPTSSPPGAHTARWRAELGLQA